VRVVWWLVGGAVEEEGRGGFHPQLLAVGELRRDSHAQPPPPRSRRGAPSCRAGELLSVPRSAQASAASPAATRHGSSAGGQDLA
jgi:hypothetical protein